MNSDFSPEQMAQGTFECGFCGRLIEDEGEFAGHVRTQHAGEEPIAHRRFSEGIEWPVLMGDDA